MQRKANCTHVYNSPIVHRGGLPYGPDRKKLDEAFPPAVLAEGSVIEHGKIEEVLGISRRSSRYAAVLSSWIGHHRNEFSRHIVFERGVGIRVLNPAELLNVAEMRTKQKFKQTGRAIRMFGWVERDRLDETGQKRLDHQLIVAAKVKEFLQDSGKKFAVDIAPVKSLPRRSVSAA